MLLLCRTSCYANKLQTSCELILFKTGFVNSLWIGLLFLYDLRYDATQRSEAYIYVTCIVHALALTLRIFFLYRYVVPAR